MHTLTRTRDAIPVTELAEALGATVDGDASLEITGVAPLAEAGASELTFLSNPRYASQLQDSKAGAVLIATNHEGEVPMTALRMANPYLGFARALTLLYQTPTVAGSVHPTAVVAETADVHPGAQVGAFVVVGEHAVVGEGTVLHPHVVVYDHARIGARCEIHSHAAIRERVTLGDGVIVQNGAILGADGFGFAPRGDGTWEKIPQVGTVVLGDDVEIQAGACLDRAAVGETRVGKGTKIDNLVQVGHGCRIGENTLLCGQVGLAGSTEIGDRATLAGQVGVAGHLRIGDDVKVAAQAGVISSLEAPGEYAGTPAVSFQEAKRSAFQVMKLPDLSKRVKALERKLKGD